MSVAQQIKDRLDIVQYIQEHVPDLKRAGRTYKACCPFHNERTPSFVVNPDTQTWRCFGACAEGGDIFSFAQKHHGWDFPEALRELGRLAGVEVRKRTPEQKQQDAHLERLRGMLQAAADIYHQHLLSDDPDAQKVLAYAQDKRGLTPATIREWQIGYAPEGWQNIITELAGIGYSEDDIVEAGLASRNDKGRVYDRFRNRLLIPISDERGRVIGFGARALAEDDNPKYLNSPQSALFDKSSTLFGLDQAKRHLRDSETAVIVEGYMDVIQAHQAGYKNVIAQMGTAMTEAQLALIAPRYVKRIIMALDSDAAGRNATRRSLEVARKALEADYTGKLAVDIRVMQIADAKDPDDVLRETPERWPQYVDGAIPVADFVIDLETEALARDASLPERQAVAQRVLPILAASENNLYTQENLQKLALRLRISEQDLLAWAHELQRQTPRKTAPRKSAPPPHQASAVPTADMPPPLPEHGAASSDQEPPPLSLDELDDWGVAPVQFPDEVSPPTTTSSVPVPQLASRHSNYAAQAYCLRMLLLDAEALPQINRKLRELAAGDAQLLDGPFQALCADDFSEATYRMIADAVQVAWQQIEQEPLDYLRDHLDEASLAALDTLLQDEPAHIHSHVGFRFQGDFERDWGQFSRQIRPGIDARADVVGRALELRRQRLERETQEIRFYLEEAQQRGDVEAVMLYFVQSTVTGRALKVLDQALQSMKQRSL